MDKIKWCAGKKEGLSLIEPNSDIANAYIKKAEEALESIRVNIIKDWKISTAYYSIYFSLYALLIKIGIKCEIHSCTIEFAKIEQEKAETKFSFLLAKYFEQLKNKLTEYFKPELLNRFDNVIAFRQLTLEEIKKIVQLQLIGLQKQILQAQGIRLEFSEEAYGLLAELGYDPVFGARPLRGVISMQLKDQLARKILKGELSQGETVKVSVEQGALVFKK